MPYGSPFVHPYAPLWQDADTEELNDSFTLSVISLCHGHVINQSVLTHPKTFLLAISTKRERGFLIPELAKILPMRCITAGGHSPA